LFTLCPKLVPSGKKNRYLFSEFKYIERIRHNQTDQNGWMPVFALKNLTE